MNCLFKVDSWILDKFQKFSDYFVKMFGWYGFQYKAAMVCLLGYYVCFIIESLLFDFNILIFLIISFSVVKFYLGLLKEEKHETSQVGEKSISMFKKSFEFARFLFLLLFFYINIVVILNLFNNSYLNNLLKYLGIFCLVCFSYFASCFSPPYQKSKFREWVEGLLLKLSPVKNK